MPSSTRLQALAELVIQDDSPTMLSSLDTSPMDHSNTEGNTASPTQSFSCIDGADAVSNAQRTDILSSETTEAMADKAGAFSYTASVSSSSPSGGDKNLFLKLQRKRLHNERLRCSLENEFQVQASLEKEEAELRQKISKSEGVISSLKDQCDSLQTTYRGLENLYRIEKEKFTTMRAAVQQIQEQLQKESGQFRIYSSQLKRLQEQLPELTQQLARTADESACASQQLILRFTRDDSGDIREQPVDNNSEIPVPSDAIREIESMQKQLAAQRSSIKQVREIVELLRRCS